MNTQQPQQFRNQWLSFSRLNRFEQCPRSFKFQYIDKLASDPGMPLRFGKVCTPRSSDCSAR